MMLLQDKVEEYLGSTIQHGPFNDRIYLMRLAEEEATREFPARLIALANQKEYSKIFAKVPHNLATDFLLAGFAEEARIPCFFSDRTDALFMGYYSDNARQREDDVAGLEKILHIAEEKRSAMAPLLAGCRGSLARGPRPSGRRGGPRSAPPRC